MQIKSVQDIMNKTNDQLIYWCMEKKLLRDRVVCSDCGISCVLRKNNRNKDGLSWICHNFKCSNYGWWVSIRGGSFFEGFCLDVKTILSFLWFWACGEIQVSIRTHLKLSKAVVVKLRNKILGIVVIYKDCNPTYLGGPGIIVQVDETMINHKVKAHRGRVPKQQCWALTMVDTSFTPSKGIIMRISDKSAATIIP